MSTKFMLTRDISGGAWAESVPFAIDSYNGDLAQNAAQSLTVPSNYPYWEMEVQCTPGIEVWVNGTGTAAAPSGSIAANGSQLIVNGCIKRYVKAGQVISFITPNASGASVSIQFLAAQNYTN